MKIDPLEREVASGGFLWDQPRHDTGRPLNFGAIKKRTRKKPCSLEYYKSYGRALREKRLRLGIVQPKDDAERAWLAAQGAA